MLARGRGLPGVGLVLFVLSTAALTRQAALQGVKDVRGRVVVEGVPAPRPVARSPVPPRRIADTLPAAISDEEFWRLISEFSEPGGSYPYENFVSNEWNQQKIVPALKKATRPGEIYIGVGPEQNFIYAAALQSKMVFVVDIRC